MRTNEIWINESPLLEGFNFALCGFTEEEPKPKTVLIDIPAGNGTIDLTESETGGVVYEDRVLDFELAYKAQPNTFAETLRRLRSLLHGKKVSIVLSWDKDYTYKGRMEIEETERVGTVWKIRLKAVCEPYKYREDKVVRVTAAGGDILTLESGQMPVCPVFKVDTETLIRCNGVTARLQPNKELQVTSLWLHEGINELYINTFEEGEGNAPISIWANDRIADHADALISERLWTSQKTRSERIADVADDPILIYQNKLISDTFYSVALGQSYSSATITYEWRDL